MSIARRPALALFVAIGAVASSASAAPRPIVAIFASEAGGRYDDVIAGLREVLDDKKLKVRPELRVLVANEDEDAEGRALVALLAGGPKVVVTLGRQATVDVARVAPAQPLVAGLVMDMGDLATAQNATAVILGHPLETQLAELRRILPDCGTFGIIHDARLTGPVRAAEAAARVLGLRLEARPIYTPKELPRAMASLSNSICALVGVPDPMVLSKHSAQEILLFQFRNRIPFIGPSEAWVDAGALYALDWRYDLIGRQLGALVLQVLAGTAPKAIPKQWPDATRLVVNPGTADKLGIRLPGAPQENAGDDH